MISFIQYRAILTSKTISLKTRMRILNAYITSIFMYNSEMWGLTAELCNKIDRFQRNILRKILMIKWPHKITNEDLYKRTKEVKWSAKIKTQRLRWVGHLMRLPEEMPARIALHEAPKPVRRPAGRPKHTWLATIPSARNITARRRHSRQKEMECSSERKRSAYNRRKSVTDNTFQAVLSDTNNHTR